MKKIKQLSLLSMVLFLSFIVKSCDEDKVSSTDQLIPSSRKAALIQKKLNCPN